MDTSPKFIPDGKLLYRRTRLGFKFRPLYQGENLYPGFRFQYDENLSKDSYISSSWNPFPHLDQMTICFRFRVIQAVTKYATFFSYYGHGVDNEIALFYNYRKNKFIIHCCSGAVDVKVPVLNIIKLGFWSHVCVSFDLRILTVKFVIDGEMFSFTNFSHLNQEFFQNGGRYVIAQDLDTLNGSFSADQSLFGDMVDFLIYDFAVPLQWMVNYTQCNLVDSIGDSIQNFREKMKSLNVFGKTKKVYFTFKEFCSSESYDIFMPYKMSFVKSQSICENWNGYLIEPKSEEEFQIISTNFGFLSEKCLSSWSTFYWLGYKGNLKPGQWQTVSDNFQIRLKVDYEKFESFSNQLECLSVRSNVVEDWWLSPCDIMTCFICNFNKPLLVRLRGICKENFKVDRIYYLKEYFHDNLLLRGEYFSVIKFDGNKWVLANREKSDNSYDIAFLIDHYHKILPFGVHTWNLNVSQCEPNQNTKLLITKCTSAELTCRSDFQCLPRSKRCNWEQDCNDNSDEFGCHIPVFPVSYSNERSPQASVHEPVIVQMLITFTSIRRLDLMKFEIHIDGEFHLWWTDGRLLYKNLQNSTQMNIIRNKNDLWIPLLYIEDGSKGSADRLEKLKSLYVLKQNDPLPDDDSTIDEDIVYSGSNNSLLLSEKSTLILKCLFHLKMYPFDVQICSFTVSVSGNQYINLVQNLGGLEFTGRRKLTEYYLLKEKILPYSDNRTHGQKVVLVFRNQYGYYIGNVILPSILLVFICYLVFYCALDDFQNRIMISLTSLLVLSSLFSQSSESIPKTTFLKFIDTWFIALITFDFLVIVDVVLIEHFRLGTPTNDTLISLKCRSEAQNSFLKRKKAEKLNQFSRRVFLLGFFSLILVFAFIGWKSVSQKIVLD